MTSAANPRTKPRRVYVPETLWRLIKAHCAKEGVSVSFWLREMIKKVAGPFVLALVASALTVGIFTWIQRDKVQVVSVICE